MMPIIESQVQRDAMIADCKADIADMERVILHFNGKAGTYGHESLKRKLLRQQIALAALENHIADAGKMTGWIKCSERMPEEYGRYWCYVEEQNCLGKSHYQWNCSWNGDVWSDNALTGRVTHWMPLPEAPIG